MNFTVTEKNGAAVQRAIDSVHAAGGGTVDLAWTDGKLTSAVIR